MSDRISEGEVIEERSLAHRPVDAGGGQIGLFGTTDPTEVLERAIKVAEPLAKFIEDRRLFKQIRDGRHVFIEGWTLLGSMLGVSSNTVWTRKVAGTDGEWREPQGHIEERSRHDGGTYKTRVIDKPGKGGWEARVELLRGGVMIASAEAECRWAEEKWTGADSHAVRSMAQTRASSKAYKTALNFIMELAGFATTPAEEMDQVEVESERSERNDRTTSHTCPECGAYVNDHRDDHDGNPKQPAWKCSSSSCPGGKKKKTGGTWGWASWDPGAFDDPWRPKLIALVFHRVVQDEEQAAALADEAAAALEIDWTDLDATPDDEAAELANSIFERVLALTADPDTDPVADSEEE